jgi:predicted SAM-dependent methyltransferase
MKKLDWLNLGCGNKFKREWINIDLTSNSPFVRSHNLLKGIPFPNDKFEVVYHSQVLEHFSREKAADFIRECYRVLKPGGIMRAVVPDLENIVNEYLKHLHIVAENLDKQAEANYDWIMLEMYDQAVRNHSGGQMAEYLQQPELINESYIIDRIGYIGQRIRNDYLMTSRITSESKNKIEHLLTFVKELRKFFFKIGRSLFSSEAKEIGKFRLGGEIHMWMYDRYSLARLLNKIGFENIEARTPFESNIPNWEIYGLDVKDGTVYDPTSLFMEAKKPK